MNLAPVTHQSYVYSCLRPHGPRKGRCRGRTLRGTYCDRHARHTPRVVNLFPPHATRTPHRGTRRPLQTGKPPPPKPYFYPPEPYLCSSLIRADHSDDYGLVFARTLLDWYSDPRQSPRTFRLANSGGARKPKETSVEQIQQKTGLPKVS